MNYNPFSNSSDSYLYQTQADVYGNSFANPMNPANMNPGFGIDPNLLTPSYDAAYRPQYTGPQPYNRYGRVGFFAGINNFVSPFTRDHMFGNPIDNNRESVEGVSSRPFDSVVWAGHRIVAPAAAFGLAFKTFARPGMAFGNAMGRGFANGMAAGMGRFMPRPIAAGLRGFLGGGMIAGRAVPGLLGAAGYLAAPLVAGQAAMEVVQNGLIDPYINDRLTARNLRSNFSGITFGDSQGNVVTGQGLSYRESTAMARRITDQGIRDLTFSSSEYGNIADYAGRAGLLDDVNSKQIVQRVKDVASQVKLVMAIASDPSIKAAIEQLAKLRNAGASLTGGVSSQAAGALTQLGLSAAVAGRSVQNIMNTVGAQGQYLYQANGMTPYLGQLAAANVLGTFESARRSGLLTSSQLARMGGTEGATQGSLTAQINASQTLLNRMAMYNSYRNGRGGASGPGAGMDLNAVVSQFGSDFSRDPLAAYGGMHMYSRMFGGKNIQDRGSLAVEDQVYAILNNLAAPRDKNGRFSAEQMAGVLSGALGWDDEAINQFIAQRTAESDPGVYRQGLRARNAQTQKQIREYIAQNQLYDGVLGRSYRGLRNFANRSMASLGRISGGFADAQAHFGDFVQGESDNWLFGSTLRTGQGFNSDIQIEAATVGAKKTTASPLRLLRGTQSRDYFAGGRLGTDIKRMFSSEMGAGDTRGVINRINALAKQGNTNAIAFINATDKASKSKALGELLKDPDMKDLASMINGSGSSDSGSQKNFDDFIQDTLNFGVTSTSTSQLPQNALMSRVNDSLFIKKGTVQLGLADSLSAIGEIHDLADQIQGGASQQDIDDILNGKDSRYDLVRKLVGNRRGLSAKKYILDAFGKSVENGVATAGHVAFVNGFGVQDLMKDPSKISDKNDRARFIAAMKSGDQAVLQEIAAKNIKAHNGGELVGTGLSGASGLSLGEVEGYQQQMDQLGIQNSKQYDLLKSGRFDLTTTQSIINNFDQAKNNKDFAAAVKNLNEAADKLKGVDSASDTGTGRSWLSSLNPFSSPALDSLIQRQQRDGGSPQNNR